MGTTKKLRRYLSGSASSIFIPITLLAIFATPGFGQINGAGTAPPPRVDIAGTQMLKFSSSICRQEYVLDVNLPGTYGDTTKSYPVLYLLDAQWDFPLIQALYGQQYYDGFVPALVIVGITWGGGNPDYPKRRAFDLSPTDVNHTGEHGNAANFLACIQREIIPFIEARYRVKKNDRTLVGSSFGGLFTLYAMFHEPQTFQKYILTSPPLGWDNGIMYAYDSAYAAKSKILQAKVFMGIGGYEDAAGFRNFTEKLKGENYAGLELETKVLEGAGHSGGKAEGFMRGLQFVYAKPVVRVEPAVLDRYAGEYDVTPQLRVTAAREGDHLVLIGPGGIRIPFYAESDSDFYEQGSFLLIHFQTDETGTITGFRMEQVSGISFAKKIR